MRGIPFPFWLGAFPLAFFLFSLLRPTPATRRALRLLAIAVPLLLVIGIGATRRGFFIGAEGFVRLLAFALPPLTAAAMAVSGAAALARRCPPALGIPLSLMNAAGCAGLVAGLWLAAFLPLIRSAGIGGLMPVILIGGGIAALITAVASAFFWRRRLAGRRGRRGAPAQG